MADDNFAYEIICTMEIYSVAPAGSPELWSLKIGKPTRVGADSIWFTHVEVVGPVTSILDVKSEDSMHSLFLAVKYIQNLLSKFQMDGLRFFFLDDEEIDFRDFLNVAP